MKGEIMNRDDIIKMARGAWYSNGNNAPSLHELERFADLVAAAEREACAKVCEVLTPTDINGVCPVADAIRKRGQA